MLDPKIIFVTNERQNIKKQKFLAIFAGISLVSIVYLFYSSKPKNIVSEVPSPQETQKINLVLKYQVKTNK